MNKKSFLVYFDWEEPFSELSKEQLGELFMYMIKYAKTAEEPQIDNPAVRIIFSFVKNAIDRDRAAYEERCQKNAENRQKGINKKKEAGNSAPKDPRNMNFNELIETLQR